MTKKLLRCAIYIRVSTAEQCMHGKSMQAQQDYLERYAKDNKMLVVGVYADQGKTARKEFKKRKAIHLLLDDVKQGKIDVILFWKMDRWFRSVSDFYKVQDILDAHNVRWIATSEPNINMDTRDGRLQLNLYLSIGQNEVDTTSERIKFVNESSIRQQKLIFGEANMPLGYKCGMVEGVKRMVKDPKTEHMVHDFFKYFMKHQSKMATIRYMKSTYGIDFTYSMLRTMLSSEFYKGTYRGFPYCPPYLTTEEWNRVQEMSKRNIKTTPSGRIYYFSGMIRCPICSQTLVGTGSTSIINRQTREKRTYCYYRCNRALKDLVCTNRHRLSQNLLEKYLLENLRTEYLKYKVNLQKVEEEKEKQKNVRTTDKIAAEMERLNVMFQKQRITWEYYDKEYKHLEEELKSVQSITHTITRDLSHLESVVASDFETLYSSLKGENKRSFWRSIIKQIHITEDNTVFKIDFL